MLKVKWLTPGRRDRAIVAVVVLALLLVAALPAFAITHGEPDGNDHPNVGSIVIKIPELGVFQLCSGTLIADDVFLTAGHCTDVLNGIVAGFPGAQVLVTFDSSITPGGTFYTGEWHTSPYFKPFTGLGAISDAGDVGVIVLDQSPGITPASLPTAALLDELKDARILKDTRFTAVGYGTVRDTNRTGFQAIMANVDRNRSEQGFNALTKAWMILPMTPSNGNGGTCYGDSGGPHFIHLNGVETDIVASITSNGDAPCKATDVTYRMDTAPVREFLGQFVTLP